MPSCDENEVDMDFTELEDRFRVSVDVGYAKVVCCDGLPLVEEAKKAKLIKVIKDKVFANFSINNVFMPMTDEGTSKGFAFIEFKTAEMANTAIDSANGYKLTKTNTLSVSKFDDIPVFANLDETYVDPEIEPFEEREHLRSWLADPLARDQWVMMKGDEVGIYWNNKTEFPDKVQNWSDMCVTWSPLGSYLVTYHQAGIALWGGDSWKKIIRFEHPNVKLIDFSPNENYLVTWSFETFPTKFGTNNIAVWDISTGEMMRSFALESTQVSGERTASNPTIKVDWPVFKWSFDDKYLAKMTPGKNGILSVYETPKMGLIDNKSIKVDDIQEFFWSPSDHTICHWTPEEGNIPARVALIKIPTREIIRTKNLFNVTLCKLFWHPQGDFLLVRVDRTKTKKSTQTSLEIFRLREKDIPVDVMELKVDDEMDTLFWEPFGSKFGMVLNSGTKQLMVFYKVELASSQQSVTLLKTIEAKVNHCSWSPKGRFCVLAGMRGLQGELQFWDTEDMTMLGSGEHYMVTDLDWDPTGRYLVTSVSYWRVQNETGFIMWSFSGTEMTKQNISQFKQFLWRPRPASLLSKAEQKKVKKNLKEYLKEFETHDMQMQNKSSLDTVQKRQQQWKEYESFIDKCRKSYENGSELRAKIYGVNYGQTLEMVEVMRERLEIYDEIVELLDE